MVSLGNAPGDGEPHTEAAVGGAGLIRPIESVKELLCLPLGQRRTGIAAPQDDAGTAAVTTPDTSADTADTHQTSDSHTALYITLGTVAALGAAAAMVVVVLRKQKKA